MKFKFLFVVLTAMVTGSVAIGQTHNPRNGVADNRNWTTAFINAHIKTASTGIVNGQMLVKGGRIEAVGKTVKIPEGARVIDLKGKWIYPSFIELCSEYGIQKAKQSEQNGHRRGNPQLDRTTAGSRYWNEAVHPEYSAVSYFDIDTKNALKLMRTGFGIVLTGHHDGVIQGTSVLMMLGTDRIDELVIRSHAAMTVSFNKGESKQDYPNSQMGSIALMRQAVYDAQWYMEKSPDNNVSLQALGLYLKTPWIGYTEDWQEVLRMDHVLHSLGLQAIIRGNGDEFKNLEALSGLKGFLVVPFHEDGETAAKIPLPEMTYDALQSMILRPQNLAQLSNHMAAFGITSSGLKDVHSFASRLREAVRYGLDPDKALAALTQLPAGQLGLDDIGDLKAGYLANFFICDSNFFTQKATVISHWTNGQSNFSGPESAALTGKYRIVTDKDTIHLTVTEKNGVLSGKISPEPKAGHVSIEGNAVYLHFKDLQLTGAFLADGQLSGTGIRDGKEFEWQSLVKSDSVGKEEEEKTFPSMKYRMPMAYANRLADNYIIRNATVWTSGEKGILNNSDVLVLNGKISGVGTDLKAPKGTVEIDGTGKHLTPGIIDEHSHIAISKGVNEGTQAVTSEVRISDVINAGDINIYRQLAGGVTTSHLLHGSANPIGGQTALIKLRYGMDAQGLLFGNDHRYIKFALGENVKQSNWGDQQVVRFPQTRMGVEQTFIDAFTRALEYEKCRAANTCAVDLELEALLEILKGERFITCHSYRQDEINMLMHVAGSFGFTVQTFTHILEGYKVADKMYDHGAGASTFADWWGYKFEVNDAIPWNAAILNETGIVTSINSDDAEMGRRLNQEAAKTVKYGGVSEEDALKMVTINPAKLLQIDALTGSIEPGKHADLVLWSGHPLSNYSKVLTTWVDGVIYFDAALNETALAELASHRLELINLLTSMGISKGEPTAPDHQLYHCDD